MSAKDYATTPVGCSACSGSHLGKTDQNICAADIEAAAVDTAVAGIEAEAEEAVAAFGQAAYCTVVFAVRPIQRVYQDTYISRGNHSDP